ncbi:50S ribosomal protein L18 [Ferrovum sp.]|jgi:large subunit ribosomal protein L18|uniref:50S ribosomal protein L18 n=1 Tax=Ferrovum sp. TaxID=2609467 RepID=UPI00344F02F2
MMHENGRVRRAKRTRAKIAELGAIRLSIHRTNQHVYAQIIDPTGSKVLASASTLEPEVRNILSNGSNIAAAVLIGQRIAEKAKAVGVEQVAFDRSGFRYHGRIKALADAAREGGLQF